MRALLISLDGITEVDHDGSLDSMYKLMDCDVVTGAGYPDTTHACWADDEALLKDIHGKVRTHPQWYGGPLVGNLLITGFDVNSGDTTEATMTVAALATMVELYKINMR